MSMKAAIKFWESGLVDKLKTRKEYKDLFAKMTEEDKLDIISMSDCFDYWSAIVEAFYSLYYLMLDVNDSVRKEAHKKWLTIARRHIDLFKLPSATYQELKQIVDESDPETRRCISKMCRDRNILKYLVKTGSEDEDIITGIIFNPYATSSILQGFVHSANVNIRKALADREAKCSDNFTNNFYTRGYYEILDQLADDEDVEVRKHLAMEMCLSYGYNGIVYKMANDEDEEVRKIVALYHNEDVSGVFIHDESVNVRVEAAQNETLPLCIEDLRAFVKDPDIRVRRAVAESLDMGYAYTCPDEIVDTLSKETDPEIVEYVKKFKRRRKEEMERIR